MPAPSCDFPLPTRWALDRAKSLSSRLPDARLRETSVVRAADLDRRADPSGATRVWLALESLQVTGSFKVRGALLAVEASPKRSVVTASVGNHGAGVAYAARVLGCQAVVVVPGETPQAGREKIIAYGADLIVSPSHRFSDAERLAMEIAEDRDFHYISPHDNELVVVGNGASLGYEIVRALGGVPDRAMAPVGTGGLVTGLASAFADESEQAPAAGSRTVCGAQSAASCAMARSLEAGRATPVHTPLGPTLADALAIGASPASYERARGAIAGIFTMSEEFIAEAMAYAHSKHRLVLEGGAAVALAPLLRGLPDWLCGGDLVVVLTGRNIEESRFLAAIQPYGSRS